MLKIKQTAS